MQPLASYDESFNVLDGEIIREARELAHGEEFSKEGASRFFYHEISDAGVNFLFLDKEDYIICYTDHDDVLQMIDADNCNFHIQNNSDRTVITLIAKKDDLNIPFTFRYDKGRDRTVLSLIKQRGTMEICFFAIAYGTFFKEKLISFKLPQKVVELMPE